jgi:hypothetical protein
MERPGYIATCMSRLEWDGTNPAKLVCTGSTSPRDTHSTCPRQWVSAYDDEERCSRTGWAWARGTYNQGREERFSHMTGGAGDVRPSFWPGASRATKLCKLCLEHIMARALIVPTPIPTRLRCRSRLIGDGPRRSPLTPRATMCMTLSCGAPIASQAAPYSRSAARRA